MFYIFSLVINNMTILRSFGFTEKSNFASLVIFMKFYEVLIFITGKLQTAFIRRMEFKADKYAVDRFEEFYGDDIKHGLQHALIKAFKKNSANLNPDWLYAALNQSHPSLYERIKAVPDSKCMSFVEPKKPISFSGNI
jgi:Zn-dependent protease with chaperone function